MIWQKAFYLCCAWALSFGQVIGQDSLALASRIAMPNIVFATTDGLGQTYTLGADNSVVKYSPTAKPLARYTHNQLGRVTYLDARNPLKLLGWYPDFQTVLFLDRTLSPLGTLPVADFGYLAPTALCTAADGNVWLYDESLQQLFKVTPEGSRLAQSQQLSQVWPQPLRLLQLLDDGRFVWALAQRIQPDGSSLHCVLQFNAYAQWLGERWQAARASQQLLYADAHGCYWTEEGSLYGQIWREPVLRRWSLPHNAAAHYTLNHQLLKIMLPNELLQYNIIVGK